MHTLMDAKTGVEQTGGRGTNSLEGVELNSERRAEPEAPVDPCGSQAHVGQQGQVTPNTKRSTQEEPPEYARGSQASLGVFLVDARAGDVAYADDG